MVIYITEFSLYEKYIEKLTSLKSNERPIIP